MKVYNKEKTKILEEYDLEKGYLKDDTITNHFSEIPFIEEKGHYEIIKEYDNGGKDVEWVVDAKGQEYQNARVETDNIQVYIPYTEIELLIQDKEKKIQNLKQFLEESDYQAIKYAEGELTDEEYLPIKVLRHNYRLEINKLEEEIEILKK